MTISYTAEGKANKGYLSKAPKARDAKGKSAKFTPSKKGKRKMSNDNIFPFFAMFIELFIFCIFVFFSHGILEKLYCK